MDKKEALRAVRISMSPDQTAEELMLGQKEAMQQQESGKSEPIPEPAPAAKGLQIPSFLEKRPEEEPSPEKKPGLLKRGAKYTLEQLNPVKAFNEIKEKWKESGAQFNEELFEEKQIQMFFRDIPEAERENYGYSQLLERARIIDQARGKLFEEKNKKRKQFTGIFSALGIKRDIVDDEEIKIWENHRNAVCGDLIDAGMKAFANDPQKFKEFTSRFHVQDIGLREDDLESYFLAQNGPFSDKIVYGLNRVGKTFKEVGVLRKMAITTIGTSGVVIGGALVGFGTLGVSAMALSSRMGISALGGLSLGIGKKLKYEGKRNALEDEVKAGHITMALQAAEKNLDDGIREMSEKVSVGAFREWRAENIFKDNRKAALWGAISAVAGRIAGEVLAHKGITFRSIMGKVGDLTGLSQSFKSIGHSIESFLAGGQKPSAEHAVLGGSVTAIKDPEALYTEIKGADGSKYIITPKGEEALQGGPIRYSDSGPKIPEDQLEQLQKMAATADAEAKARAMENFAKSPATGAEVNIPEDLQKPSVAPEAKSHGLYYSETQNHVPEAEVQAPEAPVPEVAKPKDILLGSDDIKRGGGIERSAIAIIKEDPAQFGLDPNDPKLKLRIGQKAHVLAHKLAENLGFKGDEGYEEFNRIASHRVQAGDQIRIYKDPSGNFDMEYSGKAFGETMHYGDVPDAEASAPKASQAAQEVAPSKPAAVPVEETSPKATGVAEHPAPKTDAAEQQVRGVKGAGRAPREIQDWQNQAQARYAGAVQAEQDWQTKGRPEYAAETARQLEMASQQQFLATRGLLNRVVEGAAIGSKANFWETDALNWYNQLMQTQYFDETGLQMDRVRDLNQNVTRLLMMFDLFGKPEAGMSMNEYLANVMRSSENVQLLNRVVSADIEELIRSYPKG